MLTVLCSISPCHSGQMQLWREYLGARWGHKKPQNKKQPPWKSWQNGETKELPFILFWIGSHFLSETRFAIWECLPFQLCSSWPRWPKWRQVTFTSFIWFTDFLYGYNLALVTHVLVRFPFELNLGPPLRMTWKLQLEENMDPPPRPWKCPKIMK